MYTIPMDVFFEVVHLIRTQSKAVKCQNEIRNENETRRRRSYIEGFNWDAVVLVTELGYKVSDAAPRA